MSKNTGNTKFRKIDVDKYNEDNYEEDEPAIVGDVEGPNEGEVNSLMNQGRAVEALKVVLGNSPITSKNQAVKDRALQLVVRVLQAVKTSEVETAVKSLDPTGLDMLMKYIYRAFENPSEGSSAQLLTWHEKAFAVGGLGSIVRVLTDRKRV